MSIEDIRKDIEAYRNLTAAYESMYGFTIQTGQTIPDISTENGIDVLTAELLRCKGNCCIYGQQSGLLRDNIWDTPEPEPIPFVSYGDYEPPTIPLVTCKYTEPPPPDPTPFHALKCTPEVQEFLDDLFKPDVEEHRAVHVEMGSLYDNTHQYGNSGVVTHTPPFRSCYDW